MTAYSSSRAAHGDPAGRADAGALTIRHADADAAADAAAVAAIEAASFPPAEAADAQTIRARIAAFPECFWLLCDGDAIVAFINGFATDRPDLTDDMYETAAAHDPHGSWQMLFGVATAPEWRHRGCAGMLMRRVIADSEARGRRGIVLTCKDRLVGFYAQFGFADEGMSSSEHGGVAWHQMRLTLPPARIGASR